MRTERNMGLWATGLTVLVLSVAAATARAEVATLKGTFNETLDPAANTGGARVMGIQISGEATGSELRALLPFGWESADFCVRAGTSDGVYDSENTYAAPGEISSAVTVPFLELSSHRAKLEAEDREGFGVRILKGECEALAPDADLALALWQAEEPGAEFSLLVNSFGAERLIAAPTWSGGAGDPVECRPIAAGLSVAFDKICTLPLLAGEAEVDVRLVPIKNRRQMRPETITIALPAK